MLAQALRDERLVLVDGALPLGAIVATAVLDRCSAITAQSAAALRERDLLDELVLHPSAPVQ